MASTINAVSSGAGGVAVAGDSSGVLSLQTNGTTAITMTGANAAVAGNLTASAFDSTSTFGFKNRIINGAMMIDQRNAGASVTPADGAYTIDRYKFGVSQSSKLTTQQSSTAPVGFINSMLITSSSAYTVLTGDYFYFQQRIEGLNTSDLAWGTANAATVTISFWVRSSLTGTFGGCVQNSAGTRSYPFTYSISSANTWEQKTITIAGDTTGTWLTTNGIGINVQFGLGVGSTYSGTSGSWAGANYISATGATSVVGTNGATFYITGVQLEKGSTATSFDYRPYGTELQLCQRYYEQFYWNDIGCQIGASLTLINSKFAVVKRASPTTTNTGTVTYQGIIAGIAVAGTSADTRNIQANTARTDTVGKAYFITSDTGGWTASAEL